MAIISVIVLLKYGKNSVFFINLYKNYILYGYGNKYGYGSKWYTSALGMEYLNPETYFLAPLTSVSRNCACLDMPRFDQQDLRTGP